MTEIRLMGTDAYLTFCYGVYGGWWVAEPRLLKYGPYPTLCAAWNALHLAYAEREMA